MEWSIEKRAGKVLLDFNQNARIKNLAAPLSPRTKPGAPVSMPLRWSELGDIYPTEFTIRTAIDRLEEVGDPWARILEAKHDLPVSSRSPTSASNCVTGTTNEGRVSGPSSMRVCYAYSGLRP